MAIELTVPLRDPNVPIRLYLPQADEMVQLDIPLEYAYQFPAAGLVEPATIRQQYVMPNGETVPVPRPPAHGEFDMSVWKQELIDGGRTVRLTFRVPRRSTGIGLQTDHYIYDTINVITKNHWKKFQVLIVPAPEWEPVASQDSPAMVEKGPVALMAREGKDADLAEELPWVPGFAATVRAVAGVLVLLTLSLAPSSALAQRLCSNPFCAMCARLEANWRATNGLVIQQQASSPSAIIESPAFEPTPDAAIYGALRGLMLTQKDVLYDLGCGDGRVLIAACKDYGCKGVGIEINPRTADAARRRVARAGLDQKIRVVTGDIRKFGYTGATAAFVYLNPSLIAQIAPKLTSVRVASYSHSIPGRACERELVANKYPIYLSAAVAAGIAQDQVVATWVGFDVAPPQLAIAGMF